MTAAADWSGRVGEVWAEEWRRTERAFSGLTPTLEAAVLTVAPETGRFLDIGCGVGSTSLAVARARPHAQVLGADLSGGMIAIARDRAADLPNAIFVAGDVLELLGGTAHSRHPGLDPGSRFFSPTAGSQTLAQGRGDEDRGKRFDLLFSRHGVMFFPDPTAAFQALHDAAAPGASFVFSCFAPPTDNPWATLITDAPARSASYVPGPFAFADESVGRAFLLQAGWRDPQARRIDFRYLAGEGDRAEAEALALFTRIGPAASALRDAAPADKARLLDRLRARIAEHARAGVVDFPAAAWVWSACA